MFYNFQTPVQSVLGGIISDVHNFALSAAGELHQTSPPPAPPPPLPPPVWPQRDRGTPSPRSDAEAQALADSISRVEVVLEDIYLPHDLAGCVMTVEVGGARRQFTVDDGVRSKRSSAATDLRLARGADGQIGLVFTGLKVARVFPGSPAAAAGLRKGDTLLQVNGADVASHKEVEAAFATTRGGEPFTVRVVRDRPERPQTPPLRCPGSPSEGGWSAALVIPCPDLWEDLVVTVWREGGVFKAAERVAQVVMPVAPLINSPTRSVDGQWFALWPVFAKRISSFDLRVHRYESGIPEVLKSSPRRPEPVGYLRLSVRLALTAPLVEHYVRPSPPSALRGWGWSPVPETEAGWIEQYERLILRTERMWQRLLHNVSTPPHWVGPLLSVWRWEKPGVSAAALVVCVYAAVTMDWYHFPLWMWAAGCALSCMSRGREQHSSCIMWRGDKRLDEPAAAPHTVIGHYFHAKKTIREVAEVLERVCCALENTSTLLNWTDPYLTLAMQVALLLSAVATGATLYAAVSVVRVFPQTPRFVFLAAVVLPFLVVPAAVDERDRTTPGSDPTGAAAGLPRAGALPAGVVDTDTGWRSYIADPRRVPATPRRRRRRDWVMAQGRRVGAWLVACVKGAAALATKVPAWPELQHRFICAQHRVVVPGPEIERMLRFSAPPPQNPPISPRSASASDRPLSPPPPAPLAQLGSWRSRSTVGVTLATDDDDLFGEITADSDDEVQQRTQVPRPPPLALRKRGE